MKKQEAVTVEMLVHLIGLRFRTFGGDSGAPIDNPLDHALRNHPMIFALGVDVREVVEFVLAEAGIA